MDFKTKRNKNKNTNKKQPYLWLQRAFYISFGNRLKLNTVPTDTFLSTVSSHSTEFQTSLKIRGPAFMDIEMVKDFDVLFFHNWY